MSDDRLNITAHSVIEAARRDDRAAFVVLGGGTEKDYKPVVYDPSGFRSSIDVAWKQALNGHSVSSNVRADSYGISAPAFACTNYRCEVLSEVPPCIIKKDKSISDFNPIPFFMETYPTLLWNIEASLMIYGVSYLRKVYNQYNYPSALEWIHPDDVDPELDPDGNVTAYYIEAKKSETFQMVEIRTFDPNRNVKGKAEFEVALSHITTDQAIIRHAGSFFFNAARPDGMLVSKVKMTPADVKRAEADWKQFKGSKNSWKTFISTGQWEWIPLTGAPVDLAMIDLSAKVTRDICAILKVNPALVGFSDVSDPLSAGSTMKEIKKNHVENVSLPRFNFIARALNEQWLYPDFGHGNMYSIAANTAKMPILSEVTSDRATTATTLTGVGSVMADYDETRATMNLPPRGDDYISRNPAEVNTIWLNSGMTLDQYRRMIGLEEFGEFAGGNLVRLPSGLLIDAKDLPKAAQAMLAQLIAQSTPPPPNPFGGGFTISTPHPPQMPATPSLQSGISDMSNKLGKLTRLIVQSRRSGGSGGAYVLLAFERDPQINAIQTLLQSQNSGGAAIEWTPPPDYHLTVVSADNLSPATETGLYPTLADFPALGGFTSAGLTLFPVGDDGTAPLVLLINLKDEAGQALVDYQAKLYAAIEKAQPDAALSDYSVPDKYKAHITLAYVPAGFTLPEFNFPVSLTPSSVQLSRESFEITYQTPVDSQAPAPQPPDIPPETKRATIPISLSAVWAENNFILMAQRVAAAALQDAGVTGVDWFPPHDWRMEFGGFNGTAGDANLLLNEYQPGDAPRLDVTGYKFGIVGSDVCLICDPADALGKLNTSIRLQLEDSGFKLDATPFQPAIPLGRLANPNDPNQGMDIYNALNSASAGLGMPLVISSVDLVVNGESRNSWALRSHSAAQQTELNNWRQKSTGRRVDNAFKTQALAGTLTESYVRSALANIDPTNKEKVLDVFSRAQKVLTNGVDYLDIPDAPAEYTTYWKNFDELEHNLGAAWLGYMKDAQPKILGMLATDTNPTSIMAPLAKLHAGLAEEWLGTEENPGDLVKLILSGMAAGNDSLNAQISMNPNKRSNIRAQTNPGAVITLDWALLNKQAYDFARSYSYELIRGLDSTSQAKVQKVFGDWLTSGKGLPALKELLTPIFNDTDRALAIAQTESIRAYNEGAFKRWQDVGVTKAVWRTVNDPKVCPICRPMNGQVADIQAGWIHPGGEYTDPYDNQRVNGSPFRGQVYRASAHTNCRCFRRPVVVFENGNTAGKPEKSAAESTLIPVNPQTPNRVATINGYVEPDTGAPGDTIQTLNHFINSSAGALKQQFLDYEMGLTDLDFDTGDVTVNNDNVKIAAKRFVAESQDIQYGKDYLLSLVQEQAAENGVNVQGDAVEQLMNSQYATQARAILDAANIAGVKLTEAQTRRLTESANGSYLDIVYTTDTSVKGSLANPALGGYSQGVMTDAKRKEMRQNFLELLGRTG